MRFNKGGSFSLRRRRMQIALVGIFALAGLYVASSTGLLAIFASGNQIYSDVPPNHYSYKHVQYLGGEGILGDVECAPGKFCPGEPLNRRTAAVWIIGSIMEGTPAYVSNSRFSDIDASDWEAKYIEELARREITTGCGNDENGNRKFCPGDDVRRKHMAIFLFRAFDLPTSSDAGFKDVRSGTYFESINALAAAGITTGCGDGTNFCPDRTITRAQAAIMLGRAIEWRDGPLEHEPMPEDTTLPIITVDFDDQDQTLIARANEQVSNWSYIGPLNSGACANNLFGRGTRPGSSATLDSRAAGKWYCFRAKDAADNWGFGSEQVPTDAFKDTTAPKITVGYNLQQSALIAQADEPVTEWSSVEIRDTRQCKASGSGVSGRNVVWSPGNSVVVTHPEDNNKLYCFKAIDTAGVVGFGWGRAPEYIPAPGDYSVIAYRSGPKITVRANDDRPIRWSVKRVDEKPVSCRDVSFPSGSKAYIGSHTVEAGQQQETYYCFKGVDESGTVAHSPPELVDYLPPRISFDFSTHNKYVIVEDASVSKDYVYYVVLEDDLSGDPCAQARYSSSIRFQNGSGRGRDPGFRFRVNTYLDMSSPENHGKYLCIKAIDDNEYHANTAYAGIRVIIDDQYLEDSEQSDQQLNPEPAEQSAQQDNVETVSDFWAEHCAGRDAPSFPMGPVPNHGWCTEGDSRIRLDSKRSGNPPSTNPGSLASTTVSWTETLETTAWLRGEDRVLSAQAQLQVADIIVNDTWESVALAEGADCDKTAFEDSGAINEGSEVADPELDTQYCFRVQDENGGTNYINAFVTSDSFAELDVSGSPGFGSVAAEGEEDSSSRLMLVVAIVGGATLLAVVISAIVLLGPSSRPKFR